MHAQLIEAGATPDRRSEMDRLVTGKLVPALRGFELRACRARA
jgi:hypothetical protein